MADIAEKINGWWESYRDNIIDKYRPSWLEFYQKYNNYLDEAKAKSRESNLFVPRCFDSVETAVPRLQLAMFSVNPPFQAAPRSTNDISNAEALTATLQYFNERQDLFGYAGHVLRMASILGTSIMKSGWNYKMGMPEKYIRHPQDFFKDPTTIDMKDAKYAGDRVIRCLSYLRKMEKLGYYKNIDEVVKKKQTYSPSDELLSDQKSIRDLQNPYELNIDEDDPNFEVIECYYDYGTKLCTIAGGVKIRDEQDNPFASKSFPYFPAFLVQDIVEFYGKGVIEPIRYLQDEANDLMNAMMDYISRAVNNITLVGGSEWETMRLWMHKQGAIWKCNNLEQVRALDLKPMPPEAFNMFGTVNQLIDRTLALSDYVRGTSTGSDSATAAALLAQAADTRLKLQLYTVQNCFRKMMEFDIQNMQAFLPSEFIIRITQKPYTKPLKLSDIQGEFDIYSAGIADLSTKETKRAQLVNLMNVIMGLNAAQLMAAEGKKFDFESLFRQIFETFELKNSETLIQDIQSNPMAMGAPGMVPPMGIPNNMQDVLKSTAESTAPLQTNPMAGRL